MRHFPAVLVLSLMLMVVACQRQPDDLALAEKSAPIAAAVKAEPRPKPQANAVVPDLVANPIRFALKDSGACDDRCASFEVEWIDFPRDPVLNRLVLDQVNAPVGLSTQAALRKQGQDFLLDASDAQEPWEQVFKVSLLPGLGNVSVIEVLAFSYTGGAHGMTTIMTLNVDREGKQVLGWNDILLPEKEAQFWQIARRVHREWIAQQEDAQSYESWPFVPTAMFLLTPESLVLQYDPYAIGPYSMGSPTIAISYERLRDVLKPRYLPAS